MTNPNDNILNQILQYFYDKNAHATSRFGKKGSAVKISDAKRDLKMLYGLNQIQVMSNLTYLIDRGWVKTVPIEKTVQVRGGTIPSTVIWYEVAALGIEKIEGESEFQPKERYAGINIHASGNNIITLGDALVLGYTAQGVRANGVWASEDSYLTAAPADLDTWTSLGVVSERQNRPDEAAQDYANTLRYQPAHPTALYNLAHLSLQRGNLPTATAFFHRFLEAAPDDPKAPAIRDLLIRIHHDHPLS